MTEKDIYRLENHGYVDECEHLFSRKWEKSFAYQGKVYKGTGRFALPSGVYTYSFL